MEPSAIEKSLDVNVSLDGKGSFVKTLVQMVLGVRTATESAIVEVPSATPPLGNVYVPKELRVTTIVPWDTMALIANYLAE